MPITGTQHIHTFLSQPTQRFLRHKVATLNIPPCLRSIILHIGVSLILPLGKFVLIVNIRSSRFLMFLSIILQDFERSSRIKRVLTPLSVSGQGGRQHRSQRRISLNLTRHTTHHRSRISTTSKQIESLLHNLVLTPSRSQLGSLNSRQRRIARIFRGRRKPQHIPKINPQRLKDILIKVQSLIVRRILIASLIVNPTTKIVQPHKQCQQLGRNICPTLWL